MKEHGRCAVAHGGRDPHAHPTCGRRHQGRRKRRGRGSVERGGAVDRLSFGELLNLHYFLVMSDFSLAKIKCCVAHERESTVFVGTRR